MFHSSFIEISKSAYRRNMQYLRKVAGTHAILSSVIKGNAYGHGIELMVPLAESNGIRHFSVFSAQEALQAYKVLTKSSTIMIMGLLDDDEIEWAITHDIDFFVFDMERLRHAQKTALRLNKPARIHIEAETGFNRTGFSYAHLPGLVAYLKQYRENFLLEGLCTHYAGSESLANYVRVKDQMALFKKFSAFFARHKINPRLRHTACSAALLTYPETTMDLVRVGIAQYGFWPSPETQMFRCKKYAGEEDPLHRLISWKSKVMVVKEVNAGEFIGYGSTYLANRKTRIAIVPVGYSNGFSRSLSNMGRVLIRGRRVPVIGTVTMNTMTVNVTDVPGVERGDEVVIIGKQKRLHISVASFSEMSNQINYQTLTRIPADIPRTLVK